MAGGSAQKIKALCCTGWSKKFQAIFGLGGVILHNKRRRVHRAKCRQVLFALRVWHHCLETAVVHTSVCTCASCPGLAVFSPVNGAHRGGCPLPTRWISPSAPNGLRLAAAGQVFAAERTTHPVRIGRPRGIDETAERIFVQDRSVDAPPFGDNGRIAAHAVNGRISRSIPHRRLGALCAWRGALPYSPHKMGEERAR